MRLLSREFVGLLRARVRVEVRASKALFDEYKRRRERAWRKPAGAALVMLLLVAWPVNLLGIIGPRPDLLLSLLALYATGTPFLRLASFRTALSESFERALFRSLPVSDGDFFQFTWQRFLRSSLWMLGIAVVVYFYAAWKLGQAGNAALAVVSAAGLQWLLVIAATLLLYRFRRRQRPRPGWILYGLGVLLCFLPLAAQQQFRAVIQWLPGGWANSAFAYALEGGLSATGVLAVPLVGLLVFIWVQVRSLRAGYVEPETEVPLSAREFEEEEEDVGTSAGLAPEWHEGRDRFASLRMEEIIHQGALGHFPDWSSHGWVERVVGFWLTERQRRVAEFLLADELGWWTAGWRRSAWVLSVATLACLLLSFLPEWILIFPLLVGTAMAAPLFGGEWSGLESRHSGTAVSPMYAVYPVVFSEEISAVMLKTNLVRLAACFPLLAANVAAVSWRWQIPVEKGLEVAATVFVVALVSQPLVVAGRLSRGTNDTRQTNSTSLALLFVGVIVFIAYVAVTAVLLLAALAAMTKLALSATVLAVSAAGWWFYGRLFNRGKMDMLHEPGGFGS